MFHLSIYCFALGEPGHYERDCPSGGNSVNGPSSLLAVSPAAAPAGQPARPLADDGEYVTSVGEGNGTFDRQLYGCESKERQTKKAKQGAVQGMWVDARRRQLCCGTHIAPESGWHLLLLLLLLFSIFIRRLFHYMVKGTISLFKMRYTHHSIFNVVFWKAIKNPVLCMLPAKGASYSFKTGSVGV
jgi:hypothetical protein